MLYKIYFDKQEVRFLIRDLGSDTQMFKLDVAHPVSDFSDRTEHFQGLYSLEKRISGSLRQIIGKENIKFVR